MNKYYLRRLVPRHWNERIFTWADFESFCAVDDIRVIETAMDRPAFYCVLAGQPLIFLDRRLDGPERLLAAFHELAHHWLHTPSAMWFNSHAARAEAEAELVAICCLIPATLLPELELSRYPERMIERRLSVWELNGF